MAEDNITKMPNVQDPAVQDLAASIANSANIFESQEAFEAFSGVREQLKESIGLDVPEDTILQISALFALDDDKFKIISQDFLSAFESSLNNPADKIQLCQSLNIANIKMEDLINSYQNLIELVDKELIDLLSDYKREFLKKLFGIIINSVMDSEGISKRIINIPITLEEGATVPTYANLTDAGVDVYALEEIELKPGETKIVKTGIKVEIPKGYELQVRPRSGLSAKSKLRIANAPGTIDSGYRDEIGIICENTEPKIKDIDFEYNDDGSMNIKSVEFGSSITIEKGQRIAQLVLSEVPTINFVVTTSLNMENDRNGGFGSTGA